MYHASHLMIETIKRYLSISPNNIFFSSNSLFYFYKNRNLSKCLILSFASWTILPNSLFLLSSSASENLLKIFRLKLFAFIEEFACRKNCFRLQLRFQWRSEEQSGNQVTIFFPRRWCLKNASFSCEVFSEDYGASGYWIFTTTVKVPDNDTSANNKNEALYFSLCTSSCWQTNQAKT